MSRNKEETLWLGWGSRSKVGNQGWPDPGTQRVGGVTGRGAQEPVRGWAFGENSRVIVAM